MRKRRSEFIKAHDKYRRPPSSSLKRIFRTEFSELLKSEHSATGNTNFYRTYVDLPEHTDEIKSFRDSFSDEILTVTGAKGIGKSSAIRYTYGLSSNPKFENNHLIIPFYIDNYLYKIDFEKKFTNAIRSACDLISENNNINFNPQSFYDFIIGNRQSLLSHEYFMNKIDIAYIDKIESLGDLKNKSDIIYYIMYIKYLMVTEGCSSITLIADDFESASSSFDFQVEIVSIFLAVRNCLLNTTPHDKLYSVKLLFGNRPSTFRMLQRNPTINGYSSAGEHQILKPAPVADIVRRRMDDVTTTIQNKGSGPLPAEFYAPTSKEKWEESYIVLNKIIETISKRYGNFLIGLQNYDIRRTFISILNILDNSYWYESNVSDNLEGAFRVSQNLYHINDINILYSLVMKSGYIYESVNPWLPNILLNYEGVESDFIATYIAKIYYTENRKNFSSFKEGEIKNRLSLIYSPTIIERYFDRIVAYLEDRERPLLRRDMINKESIITSQPSLLYLLNALRKSSALVQMYAEDTYVEYSGTHYNNIESPISLLNQEEQLFQCIDFSEKIFLRELQIIETASKMKKSSFSREYKENFGSESISKICLTGIELSLKRRYSGHAYPVDIRKKYENCNRITNAIQNIINTN